MLKGRYCLMLRMLIVNTRLGLLLKIKSKKNMISHWMVRKKLLGFLIIMLLRLKLKKIWIKYRFMTLIIS